MASKENTDDTEYSDKNDKDIEVCRDFLNKCCSFGALCKYQHPESDTSSKSRKRARSQSPMSKAEGSNSATCRDFLRNMCTRGKNCRFYHPPEEEVNKKSWFTLCLDFQNGGCSRYDCRLVAIGIIRHWPFDIKFCFLVHFSKLWAKDEKK